MMNSRFMEMVDESNLRSRNLLEERGKVYGSESDRLIQFRRMAAIESRHATECLFSQATKQFTALAGMVKDPDKYTGSQWAERIDDLRNYMVLLEGLLEDAGIVK